MKKQYKVSAPAYGIIRDGFSTRYQAQKFARRWERDNNYGRGVARVSSYDAEGHKRLSAVGPIRTVALKRAVLQRI